MKKEASEVSPNPVVELTRELIEAKAQIELKDKQLADAQRTLMALETTIRVQSKLINL